MCASPTSPPFFGGEFTYAQLNYTSTVDASAHHSVEIWCQSRPSQLLQAPNFWNKVTNHTLPKPPEVPHPSVSTFPGTFGNEKKSAEIGLVGSFFFLKQISTFQGTIFAGWKLGPPNSPTNPTSSGQSLGVKVFPFQTGVFAGHDASFGWD